MSNTVQEFLFPLLNSTCANYIQANNIHVSKWGNAFEFLERVYIDLDNMNFGNLNVHPLRNLLLVVSELDNVPISLKSKYEELKSHLPGFQESQDKKTFLCHILTKRTQLLRSAINRDKEFNLTDADVRKLLERKTCYYTGIPFSETDDNFKRTVDRIDPNKGYVKGNVVACLHGVNQMKANIFENPDRFILTKKQLTKFVDRLPDTI